VETKQTNVCDVISLINDIHAVGGLTRKKERMKATVRACCCDLTLVESAVCAIAISLVSNGNYIEVFLGT
jgi:hypothetical protein